MQSISQVGLAARLFDSVESGISLHSHLYSQKQPSRSVAADTALDNLKRKVDSSVNQDSDGLSTDSEIATVGASVAGVLNELIAKGKALPIKSRSSILGRMKLSSRDDRATKNDAKILGERLIRSKSQLEKVMSGSLRLVHGIS